MSPARPSLHRRALRAAGPITALAALSSLSSAGCYFSDEGLSPPQKSFYYPTGLAVSPGRGALYVASSDFDLQYNGGTINVLDLHATRATLETMLSGLRCVQGATDACGAAPPAGVHEVCAGLGLDENHNQILTPSACTALTPAFAADGGTFATIGAFASGTALSINDEKRCVAGGAVCFSENDCGGGECKAVGGARLFVPVRGDPSITWFDVVDDRDPSAQADVSRLDCGQTGNERRCADEHRLGVDPYDNFRTVTLPVEPVGLDVSDDGRSLASAHQIQGGPAVGLSVATWPTPTLVNPPRPTFQYYLTANIPAGPMEVARVPVSGLVKTVQARYAADPQANPPMSYQPGFLMTYNASAQVDLYRVNDDAVSVPPRPFLTRAASSPVTVNADGKDSRGIVVDPTRRQDCERDCQPMPSLTAPDLACLRKCVDTPIDFFVANRAPPSLLLGRLTTTVVDDPEDPQGRAVFDQPEIYDAVSLAVGPSKVALGNIIGLDGQKQRRIFAVTFESRFVFVYDPDKRRVDAVIRTGRGPHAIAFDTGDDGDGLHSYLYVGHFTDSYLGVVDLDMRHPETFGIMFASIGVPTPPRESK